MGKVRNEDDEDPYGSEVEKDANESELRRPYDPKKIRVDPRPLSVKQVMEMIADGDLDVAPDFQRRTVWKQKQKSLLIESILLRIPLPVFYFSADEEGKMQVVDGVQRITSIRSFIQNEYPLSDLEYLQDDLKDKCYSDMDGSLWIRRLMQTPLTAFVIDPQTPDDVKFDIFRRLNTGGAPLTPQEIRHRISKPRSRKFLAELCNQSALHVATRNQVKDHTRMLDRELALRYCAFKLLPSLDLYSSMNGMDDFLTKTVRKLDDPAVTSQSKHSEIKRDFIRAMEIAFQIFGEHAFRKWYLDSKDINPINRALFDVWSVVLSQVNISLSESQREKICNETRTLMTNDDAFVASITSGTSKPNQVTTRFEKIDQLIKKVLG